MRSSECLTTTLDPMLLPLPICVCVCVCVSVCHSPVTIWSRPSLWFLRKYSEPEDGKLVEDLACGERRQRRQNIDDQGQAAVSKREQSMGGKLCKAECKQFQQDGGQRRYPCRG